MLKFDQTVQIYDELIVGSDTYNLFTRPKCWNVNLRYIYVRRHCDNLFQHSEDYAAVERINTSMEKILRDGGKHGKNTRERMAEEILKTKRCNKQTAGGRRDWRK